MGNRGLSIFAGIAGGVDSAVKNLYALSTAKTKLAQEKEIHDLDVKSKKLELQKAEILYGPEQIQGQKELLNNQIKLKNTAYNIGLTQISEAEKNNKQTLSDYKNKLSTLGQIIDLGELGLSDPNKVDQKKIIENKVSRGETLLPGEQKLYDDSINKSKPTQWDLQKEARTTVNSMLQNNPELQGKVFENPAMLTDLIDKEVGRLQTKYIGSARVEPSPTEDKPLGNASQSAIAPLPVGITEESIQHTLKLHPEYTRETLIKYLESTKK